MKAKLFLSILSLFCFAAKGQNQFTVSGRIKSVNGNPVASASVQLVTARDLVLLKTTITDTAGFYRLDAIKSGSYIIKITAVESIKNEQPFQSTGNTILPDIILLPETKVLQNIMVNATNRSVEVKDGKLTYNIEKAITATGSNALELLRRTPGITVDGDENILLKGSSTVNIMMDGKMTYLTSAQLSSYLKNLPAENLAKIEVITTPSSQYDAAGNAGIINIVTKKMGLRGYGLNVSAMAGGGRYGQTTDGFIGNIRTKQFNVFGSYNYSYNHSFLDRSSIRSIGTNSNTIIYDRRSFDPTIATNNSYKAGIDIFLGKKNQLGFVYIGSVNNWQRNAAGPTYLFDQHGGIDSIVLNHNINHEPENNNAYNLNYLLKLDTMGKQLNMDADYASYINNRSGSLGNGFFSAAGLPLQTYQELVFKQPSKIAIHSIKLDMALPYHEFILKAGLKFGSVSSDNDFVYDSLINGNYVHSNVLSNHFLYDEKIFAGYVSFSRQINKKVSLDAGARLELTSSLGNSITSSMATQRSYTNLFPYFSITKNLAGNNSFSVSVSQRINRPVYANLNPFRYYFDKFSYAEGNPFLQPELAWNTAVSYTFKQNYIATATYSRTTNAMLGTAIQDSATGILSLTTVNFSHKDAADLLLVIPIKLFSCWDVQNTIDFGYLSFVYHDGKNIVRPEKLNLDIQSVNNFTLPQSISAELTVKYTSPTLSGVYMLRSYFEVYGGIKKSFCKKKLDVKLAFSDLLKTDRYWGYSILSATNVRYDHRPDSRRIKLALTYHLGGKLSTGKVHKLDEQERL